MKASTSTIHNRYIDLKDIDGDCLKEMTIAVNYRIGDDNFTIDKAVTLDKFIIPSIINAINMAEMKYKSVKESDGTYSIRQSKFGLSWDVVKLGVRGCNVERTINKLRKGK